MKSRFTKVMIVEDSLTQLLLLEDVINSDPRLKVVATARSAEEAIRILPGSAPDVVSMDIHLPKMNGYQATTEIMQAHPVPIVVVSASVNEREAEISMNSLKAGALSVVQKPPGPAHPQHERLAATLCDQLAIMSEVRVVRQRPVRTGRAAVSSEGLNRQVDVAGVPELVGIVASTGGPPALAQLLASLPSEYPIPILLVQHMTSPFLSGFIQWLDGRCPLRVVAAEPGEVPLPGKVYVAPGGSHLEVSHSGLRLSKDPPVSFQRPSGTVLFRSMARVHGSKAWGVLLTGMGDDGAEGLLELRRKGAHTIAEHHSTAIVYGMPKAAEELKAAEEFLPLSAITNRLLRLDGRRP